MQAFETYITTAQQTLGQLLSHLREALPDQAELADQAEEQMALLFGRLDHDLPLVSARRIWELRTALLETQQEITDLTTQQTQTQETLTSLEERRTGDLDRLSVLQQELNTAREELRKSIEREQILQAQIDQQVEAQVQAELAQCLIELEPLTQKVVGLEQERTASAQQILTLEAELTQIHHRITELETLAAQTTSLEAELATARQEIARLTEQLAQTQPLAAELAQQQGIKLQLDAELATARQQLAELTAQPTKPKLEAVGDMENLFQELTTEIANLRQEQGKFSLFMDRLNQQQERQEQLEAEIARLRNNQTDGQRKQTTVRALLQEAGLDPDSLE